MTSRVFFVNSSFILAPAISNRALTTVFKTFVVSSSTTYRAAMIPFMLLFHSAVNSIRVSALEAEIT